MESPVNWTGYTDSFFVVLMEGSLPCQIDISYDAAVAQWTGNVSTDWDSCTNWLNLRVPDENTDVYFVPMIVIMTLLFVRDKLLLVIICL